MTSAWIILIYGALVAVGGVIGYVRANSVASLAAGGAAGVILIAAGVAMMRGAYQIGWWVALVVVLLLGRFAASSFGNFKMMPGGLMIVLSVIAIIALLWGRTTAAPSGI